MKIKVAPSILSANFGYLNDELKKVERSGADLIHIDVMDGHFVPNITIGPVVVKGIRKITKLPLDVHLMIEEPEKFVNSFVDAGSDMITFHIETISKEELEKQSMELKKANIKIGISLNPATPLEKITPLLGIVDFVLVMSVNPGFGGQDFIPEVLPKIRELRLIFDKDIAVDGGINERTALSVVAAGANVLAVGSYIFKSNNYRDAIRILRCAK